MKNEKIGVRTHKNLDVWMRSPQPSVNSIELWETIEKLRCRDKSHILVKDLYLVTSKLPKEELFRMTSQIRRAVVSIPTNIVEGSGRRSDADFRRFLQIAFGSASEVEYLLFLSHELNYIDKGQHIELDNKIKEVKKMLAGMIKTISLDISNSKWKKADCYSLSLTKKI